MRLRPERFERYLAFLSSLLPIGLLLSTVSLFSSALLAALILFVPEFQAPAQAQSKESVDCKPSNDKKYQGYIIRQTALNQGSVTTYLCPTCWVLKTAIITVAGDHEKDTVVAYTRATNKYLSDSLQKGMKRFSGFRRGGDFAWGPPKKIGQTKWHDEDVVIVERKGRRTDLHTKNDVIITEKLLYATRFKLSKAYEMVAFSLIDVDCSYGLPLRIERMASSKNPRYCTLRPVVVQDTLSIKKMTFKASDFAVPRGLVKVKTEIDLFSNDEGAAFDPAGADLRSKARKLNMPVD